ncbi:hypothetical protein RBB50_009270 [Rhinocladiella similis]
MLQSWKGSVLAKDVELLLPALEKGETRDWQALFTTASNSASSTYEMFPFNTSCSSPRLGILQDATESMLQGIEVHEPANQAPRSTDFHGSVQVPPPENPISYSVRNIGGCLGGMDRMSRPSIALPANAKQMIDEYLAYTNCCFPILEPHELFRTLYQCRKSDSAITLDMTASGQVAVLWAVFAFELAKKLDPESSERREAEIQQAYKTARALIPAENEQHEFGHIQALLILSMINIGHGRWRNAWLLAGYAQGLLDYQQICAEKRQAQSQIDQRHNSRQPHVLRGVTLMESLLVRRLGRPLRPRAVPQHAPLREDGLEEWEPSRFPDLHLHPQYEPGTEIPARILSSFNGLCRTTNNLDAMLRQSDPKSETSDCSEQEEFLAVLQRDIPELYSDYLSSHYPQFLLRYVINQSASLALTSQHRTERRSKVVENSKGHPSGLDALAPIVTALTQFRTRHGASRVPVLLITIIHPLIQDIVSEANTAESNDNPTVKNLCQELTQLLEEFGKYWPAFTESSEILLSLNDDLYDTGNSDTVNRLRHGRSQYVREQTRLSGLQAFSTSTTATDAATTRVYKTNRGPGVDRSDVNDLGVLAVDDDHLLYGPVPQNSTALSSNSTADIDNLYLQLAPIDIMQWSGNWQQEGLPELGFDNDSFEQLYNR